MIHLIWIISYLFILHRILLLSFFWLLHKLLLFLFYITFISNCIWLLYRWSWSPFLIKDLFKMIFLFFTFIFNSNRWSSIFTIFLCFFCWSKLYCLSIFIVISFLDFTLSLKLLQQQIVTSSNMIMLICIYASDCIFSYKAFLLK